MALSPTSSRGSTGTPLFTSSDTTLTNAQIKALAHPTPVQLVAAPGAGNVIRLVQAFVTVDAVAAAYTNIAATATLTLGYIGGSDASISVAQANGNALGVLLGLDGEVTFVTLLARASYTAATDVTASPYDASEGANLPLGISIFNPTNLDLTGGNAANSARVKVWYTVEALA